MGAAPCAVCLRRRSGGARGAAPALGGGDGEGGQGAGKGGAGVLVSFLLKINFCQF